jgi:hypothetical protein
MSIITQPGQRCGHKLRPAAQFCTVCGRRVADDARRTAPGPEEQPPAAAPQPATPSGWHQGCSLPARPPGQGCGHELRLGAQFCIVCGRPAAGGTRRTGLIAEERVPTPGPEATAIRPVPARPEPVTPTSPATMTGGPSKRSPGGGAGSGPQWGWAGPSPAPGEVIPRRGGTTPRQDRRHRSRWPWVAGAVALLAAGAAAAAVSIGQPLHNSHAAAGTSE